MRLSLLWFRLLLADPKTQTPTPQTLNPGLAWPLRKDDTHKSRSAPSRNPKPLRVETVGRDVRAFKILRGGSGFMGDVMCYGRGWTLCRDSLRVQGLGFRIEGSGSRA